MHVNTLAVVLLGLILKRRVRRRSWWSQRTVSWSRWLMFIRVVWSSPLNTSTSTTAAQRKRKVRSSWYSAISSSVKEDRDDTDALCFQVWVRTLNGLCLRSERFTCAGTTSGARLWRSFSSTRPTTSWTSRRRSGSYSMFLFFSFSFLDERNATCKLLKMLYNEQRFV